MTTIRPLYGNFNPNPNDQIHVKNVQNLLNSIDQYGKKSGDTSEHISSKVLYRWLMAQLFVYYGARDWVRTLHVSKMITNLLLSKRLEPNSFEASLLRFSLFLTQRLKQVVPPISLKSIDIGTLWFYQPPSVNFQIYLQSNANLVIRYLGRQGFYFFFQSYPDDWNLMMNSNLQNVSVLPGLFIIFFVRQSMLDMFTNNRKWLDRHVGMMQRERLNRGIDHVSDRNKNVIITAKVVAKFLYKSFTDLVFTDDFYNIIFQNWLIRDVWRKDFMNFFMGDGPAYSYIYALAYRLGIIYEASSELPKKRQVPDVFEFASDNIMGGICAILNQVDNYPCPYKVLDNRYYHIVKNKITPEDSRKLIKSI